MSRRDLLYVYSYQSFRKSSNPNMWTQLAAIIFVYICVQGNAIPCVSDVRHVLR